MKTMRLSGLVWLSLALAACGSDDGNNGGTGGTVAATGGTVAATGGVGATGGTGGVGATGGTGGTVAGTGGAAGTVAGTTGGTGATFVPGSPTFTAIFEETIKPAGCNAGAFCHGGSLGQGSLLLTDRATAYAALVNVAAMGVGATPPNCVDSGLMRVVPGSPDTSLLVQKVEGTQTCGTAMPPPPATLTDAQKMQIRTWVQNGALDD